MKIRFRSYGIQIYTKGENPGDVKQTIIYFNPIKQLRAYIEKVVHDMFVDLDWFKELRDDYVAGWLRELKEEKVNDPLKGGDIDGK